jgi:hypothetical protein
MTIAGGPPRSDASPRRWVRPVRRWVLGDHPWGRLEIRVLDRTGTLVQHVLVVYPPGTNDGERVALWFARSWPWAGAVGGIGVLMVLGDAVQAGPLLVMVGATYAAGVLVGLRMTRRVRPRVRRVSVTTPCDACPRSADGRLAILRRATRALDDLDGRAARGECDPVHYEAAWARIYAALGRADAEAQDSL